MRAVIVIATLLAVAATAMPHDRADEQAELEAAGADITELSGDALLEARAGLQAQVGANEAFDTAPYKFFVWNPTQALTRKAGGQEFPLRMTQWGPRRTPQEINKKLKQSITGAGLPTKCGANDRCVLLGPEFVAHGNDRLTITEYNEYKRDLIALSTTYQNILLAPGTIVFKAKASQQRCTADHLIPFDRVPKPVDTATKVWYGSKVDYEGCMYNFNVLVVAFRGAVLIEHYKIQDGGSAVGGAFDLAARPDLVGATTQSQFHVPAWGNILVGVEICADHDLHRVKTATNDLADLQLSPFYPGSISANTIAMTGVKDGGFVVQNGGNSVSNQVFKRNGQTLTRFYRAAPGHQGYVPQVGVSRAFDVYEYIGVAQPPPVPPQGGPPQLAPQQPGGPRRPVRSNSQRTLKPVRPVTRTNSQPQIKRRGST